MINMKTHAKKIRLKIKIWLLFLIMASLSVLQFAHISAERITFTQNSIGHQCYDYLENLLRLVFKARLNTSRIPFMVNVWGEKRFLIFTEIDQGLFSPVGDDNNASTIVHFHNMRSLQHEITMWQILPRAVITTVKLVGWIRITKERSRSWMAEKLTRRAGF